MAKNRHEPLISNTALIIPIFNEAQVIGSVIGQLSKTFQYIVCVNDGSSDSTYAELMKTDSYIIEHPVNMGQGAALQTGIEFARQLPVEYFVTFDADGQHRIEDVKLMLSHLNTKKYDIILGSRFLGSTIGMTRLKLIILKLAILFSNSTSGIKLTDTHNGLRAFNRTVAEGMQITLPDMSHASEIIELIAKNRYRYIEVPVTIEYTDYSKRKGQSLLNAINISFDTILRKITK